MIITEGYNICVQIVTYAMPHTNMYWAYLIMVILLQSQGTLYFMAYFRRHIVRETWLTFLFPNAAASTRASLSVVNNSYNTTSSAGVGIGPHTLDTNIDIDPKTKVCYRICACLLCIDIHTSNGLHTHKNNNHNKHNTGTGFGSGFGTGSGSGRTITRISDSLRIDEALIPSGYLVSEAGSLASNRGTGNDIFMNNNYNNHNTGNTTSTNNGHINGHIILGGDGRTDTDNYYSNQDSESEFSTGTGIGTVTGTGTGAGTGDSLGYSRNSDSNSHNHSNNHSHNHSSHSHMSPNGTTVLGLEDL